MQPQTCPDHWPFLDVVRGGAALLVMLGHARGSFLPEYAALTAPGPVTKAVYLLSGLQHEGVVLFFLVSGFLVGGSAWSAIAAGAFDPVRYLANRFVRIYLVFVPGLMLTLAVTEFGRMWLADAPGFSTLPLQPWTWQSALCHTACLQGVYCSVLPGNAPLWSLAYEWLLYLAAPLVLGLTYARIDRHWRLVAFAVLGATFATVLPQHLLWSWVMPWTAGAVAARAIALRPLPSAIGLAGIAVTVCGLVASRLHVFSPIVTDAAITVSFGLALATPSVLAFAPVPRLSRFLADCSYSLYVVHLPVILLAGAILHRLFAIAAVPSNGAGAWLAFAATAGFSVAVAALFARATERHTRRVQRLLLADRARPA